MQEHGTPRRSARAATRAVAALGAVLALAAPAGAREPEIEFTVRPAHPGTTERTAAWLIRTAEPGTRFRDAVIVQNLGEVTVDLVLYPADAQTTPAGDFTVEPEEGSDDDVAAWVTLERGGVTLEPGEYVKVPFRVEVPENATPGDHAGGIVARTAEPLDTGPLPAHLAVAARLYLTVDGPLVYDLRVTGVRSEPRADGVHFFLDLENAGNTILEVEGAYRVEAPFGLGGGEGTIESPATLIPGAAATKEVVWPGEAVLGGRHVARFELRYGDGRLAAAQVSFFLTPPLHVLAAAGLIALSLVALVLVPVARRRRTAAHA